MVDFAEKSAYCRSCAADRTTDQRKARPEYHRDYYKTWKVRRLAWRIWDNARRRAVEHGVPFDLAEGDVTVPEICPIFGTPLIAGTRQDKDASPTLDRKIPALGYVRGNVSVISHRANRIKSDATIAELEKIVAWIRATL